MPENGFSLMGRDLKRIINKLRSLDDSGSKDEEPEGIFLPFDAATLNLLSQKAQEEDMDTGPFVIELVNSALHGQGTQKMIEHWKQLTAREQEVAALACKGMTNPQIARALFISEETAKKHISSILKKFEIRGHGILKWILEGWNFDNPQAPWKI